MKYWSLSLIDTLDSHKNLVHLKEQHCYQCGYNKRKVLFCIFYTDSTRLKHVNVCDIHSYVVQNLGEQWPGEVVSLDFILKHAKITKLKCDFIEKN